MNYKRSVIPLILLFLTLINISQALENLQKTDYYSLDEEIQVSLPKEAMSLTDTLSLPLQVSGLSGQEVYSCYFRIAFDPQVITINDVELGNLTEEWNTPIWNIVNNELRISHYGVSPFTTSGVILNILVTANGEENSSSELEFVLAALNEGDPNAIFNDGRVFLGNPLPVITSISDTLFSEGSLIQVDLFVSDPLDRNLSLNLSNFPSSALYIDNGDGSASFTWQADYFSAGQYNMLFTAVNSDLLSSSVNWDLLIENTPQAPEIVESFPDVTFLEDEESQAYTLLDYVSDGDLNQGDTLFVTLDQEEDIVLNYQNGQISYSAQNNYFGTKNITLIISDTYGYQVQANIQVTVTNVNDAIVQLEALPLVEIDEDYQAYSLDLNQFFSDIDNELSFAINNDLNVGYTIDNSLLTINPDADWFGNEIWQLVVTEGAVVNLTGQVQTGESSQHQSSYVNLSISVISVNDAPVILNSFAETQVLMNSTASIEAIDTYFSDVDSELEYSFTGNSNVNILYQDNSFIITPNPAWVGVERVTVTASDEYLESVSQVLVLRVQAGYLFTENFNHMGSLPNAWSATGGSWLAVNTFGDDWALRVLNPRISRTQRLISPAFDLSGIYEIELSYDQEIDLPAGVSAILQYSLNGFTYYNIETFTSSSYDRYSVSLPQVENNSNVRFRWQYTSSTLASNYWKIDNLQLSGIVGNYLPPAPVNDLALTSVGLTSVELEWTSIENNFFNQYEISVMSSPSLTDQLFIWNASDDSQLFTQETTSTQVSGLISNQGYYFAIRSSDVSGNVSEWSPIISATPTALPTITFISQNDYWFNSLNPLVSFLVNDDVMIDAASLAYRLDSNNNGIYDTNETWQLINSYQNSNEINVDLSLQVPVDALAYRLEIRCRDTQNDLYVYSGEEYQMGIADDYSFNVDTLIPESISELTCEQVDQTSLTLSWIPYSAQDFAYYEIYYADNPQVTTDDILFTTNDDANLALSTTVTSQITNLNPNQRYWFTILVVDLAGNRGLSSNIVTNVLNSELPLIYDIEPIQTEPITYSNSRMIELSCKIKDAYGIDYNSVQFRIDANGNGLYDSEEEWTAAFTSNSSKFTRNNQGILNDEGDYVLAVNVEANYLTDGNNLAFEFRAKDIDGYGYVYTGINNSEGISDDFSVSIDATAPAEITTILVGLTTSSTAQIGWSSSSDTNFQGYKIFYSNEANVTANSDCVSWYEYPALANPGTGLNIFLLPDLQANSQYYLRVAAVDLANNLTFSEEVSFSTSSDAKPNKPENVTITFQGTDLILSWDNVTQDTNGNDIDNVIYDIYVSESPDFELDGSNYYDSTYENQYIFYGIGDALPKIFFKVQAYSD